MSLDVSEFKVATFDVFDTLLVRAVGDPKDVFLLVGSECGRRNFLSLGPENFRSARIQAEDLARANHDHKECSLDDIYEVLGRLLALEKETVVAIRQLELEIEAGVLRPCLDIITRRPLRLKNSSFPVSIEPYESCQL